AHAVDRHHGAIVHRRELAFERCRLDLDDVLARMGDLDLNVDLPAGGDDSPIEQLAVTADLYLGGRSADAFVLDTERYGLVLAHDAEARRRDQHHAAILFIGIAGDEGVHRRRE